MAVVIYDKKTGEEVKLNHPIDAKEWVATGKYVEEKPKAKPTKTEAKL